MPIMDSLERKLAALLEMTLLRNSCLNAFVLVTNQCLIITIFGLIMSKKFCHIINFDKKQKHQLRDEFLAKFCIIFFQVR